jgi:hypothetical protein
MLFFSSWRNYEKAEMKFAAAAAAATPTPSLSAWNRFSDDNQ